MNMTTSEHEARQKHARLCLGLKWALAYHAGKASGMFMSDYAHLTAMIKKTYVQRGRSLDYVRIFCIFIHVACLRVWQKGMEMVDPPEVTPVR